MDYNLIWKSMLVFGAWIVLVYIIVFTYDKLWAIRIRRRSRKHLQDRNKENDNGH